MPELAADVKVPEEHGLPSTEDPVSITSTGAELSQQYTLPANVFSTPVPAEVQSALDSTGFINKQDRINNPKIR